MIILNKFLYVSSVSSLFMFQLPRNCIHLFTTNSIFVMERKLFLFGMLAPVIVYEEFVETFA